jgi:sugar phosphate isomerase/epimerase
MDVLIFLGILGGIALILRLIGLISSYRETKEENEHLYDRNARSQNEVVEYKRKLAECQVKLNALEENDQKTKLLSVQNIEYKKKLAECQVKLNALEENEQKRVNFHEKILERIKIIFKKRQTAFPWLAGMMADFLTLAEEEYQKSLERTGKKVQLERAFKINELRKEIRRLIQENKILKYEMDYVKTLGPVHTTWDQ